MGLLNTRAGKDAVGLLLPWLVASADLLGKQQAGNASNPNVVEGNEMVERYTI